jgi:hypothetical protein
LVLCLYFNSGLIPPLPVLHPSHKLAYFSQAGWPEEWRATAEEIVRAEFERAYADIEIADSNETVSIRVFFIPLKFYFYFVCNLLGPRC